MANTLFDIPPRDPHVSPEAAPRLKGQNAATLERLRAGRATNKELAGIALKYTSRLSDLRAAGYDERCVRQDRVSGVAHYALFVDGVEVRP